MNFESFKALRYRNICAKLKFKWQLENERIFLVATFFWISLIFSLQNDVGIWISFTS